MTTAVWIHSDSGDDYLYCTTETLNEKDALDWAEPLCDEERDYWCDWMVVNDI